ncbi:MAG: FecR domain-containing protein [Cyclobacteriaceae bacterium]
MKSNPDKIKNLLLAKELILQLEFKKKESSEENYDRVLHKILTGEYSSSAKPKHEARSFRFNTFLKVAASLFLVGSLYLFQQSWDFLGNEEDNITKSVIKSNPSGRKSQVLLPDGTMVSLNAESRLEYTIGPRDKVRLVKLDGEAFFDVAKDETTPFIVETTNLSIKAIGTQFNVRAYREDPTQEISLTEGKVIVDGIYNQLRDGSSIPLNPGQAISIVKSSGKITESQFNPKKVLSWKDNIIYFEDASIDEVIESLERWYGMKFVLVNPAKSGQWKFDSEFNNESLENVLRAISYAKKFKYSIEENTVKIIFE